MLPTEDAGHGVVIVGGGQAGAVTAMELRRLGFAGPVTILGAEEAPPYERPPLSKSLLLGDTTLDDATLLTTKAAKEQDITLRLATRVDAIDRAGKQVALADGSTLPYDSLVIATGGEARRLPDVPVDDRTVFVIRSAADTAFIRARANSSRRVLIVGGGWLGLETAASLSKLGLDVTLIEAGDRLCARSVPAEVSRYLLDLHEARGVTVRLQTTSTSLRIANSVVATEFSDGRVANYDFAVIAVGLEPNDQLAAAAGLATDNGILTDPAGRTDDPAILAIGDCTRFRHPQLGQPVRMESWQNANIQAGLAARVILGEDPNYEDIAWFWSDQFEHNIQILGFPNPSQSLLLRGSDPPAPGSMLFHEDGILRAIIAFDMPRDIAMSRQIIKKGQTLDMALASDPSIALRKAVRAA